jgi:hypothetical protein
MPGMLRRKLTWYIVAPVTGGHAINAEVIAGMMFTGAGF